MRLLRWQPPCQEMVPLMSQSLERTLGLREYLSLQLHLLVCVWCVRYLKHLKFLRHVLRHKADCPSEDALPSLSLSAAARVKITLSIKASK